MLPHPTHDRLIALGLVGMAKAFEEQRALPTVTSLTFEERLGLLVDREAVERESKRLVTRLKFANLRQNATIEDLNTKAARGLDKALFAKLATGDWITRRQDLLITGKTGTGKSWLACALAHKLLRTRFRSAIPNTGSPHDGEPFLLEASRLESNAQTCLRALYLWLNM